MSIHDLIENLPDELQRYLMEYGLVKKNVYVTENGIFTKKYRYEFQSKLNLNDDKYKTIKHFVKRYDELYINLLTGRITIVILFPVTRMMYWWQASYYCKKLSIHYENNYIYCEYYKNTIDEIFSHCVKVYDNGDILFSYAPTLPTTLHKKQIMFQNKLHAKSNFII